jgi:N-acetylglutamate synthase-like GNAT family acetyltransferase
VKIRPATQTDIEAIHVVHVTTMQRLQETDAQPSEEGRKGVEAFIASRSPDDIAAELLEQRFVVAEVDGEIAGFGALDIPKTEISMVFVSPVHQREGIGHTLLTELESIASRAGLEAVKLQATGTAIGFYLKNGYQSDPPVKPDARWAIMMKKVC